MENDSVLDTSFVRQSFYLDPPAKDASPEEWKAWVKEDCKMAKVAKAAHTRLMNELSQDEPLEMDVPCVVRKIGGVYRSSPTCNLVGDFEEGTGSLEPAVECSQEKLTILGRWNEQNHRGSKSKGKAARRRANRKARGV